MDTNYKEDYCWQYNIRLKNREEDLRMYNLTESDVKNLRVDDFSFEFVNKKDQQKCLEIKKFIERHEWLGKMSLQPTHRFTARWKGILCGVVIMDVPTAFSKLLGDDTSDVERLISRGACISWSPKNLGSWMIMKAIKWMVHNTPFRLFVAYSDPDAKELGSIYQACSFIYLGQTSGTAKQYLVDGKWTSDRHFRERSAYKRYAKELNINWKPDWNKGNTIFWDKIPKEDEEKLRAYSREAKNKCESRLAKPKHKYCFILGASKKETIELRNKFYTLNPEYENYTYPKQRGK